MKIVIALTGLMTVATTTGGFVAIRVRDRLHLVLGLSAGLLLGLLAFDLLPEVYEMNSNLFGNVRVVSIALIVGFLVLHFIEQLFGSHEPAHSEDDHKHSINMTGTIGAIAMAGHVFLDGITLGLAFKVSNSFGYAVFAALIAHAFSDGLNTVTLLIKSGHWKVTSFKLLGFDALMRISGGVLGSYIALSDQSIAIYLAAFSGMVIYISTSHILPEAHSRHSSRLTMLATIAGVVAMWLVVANIGE